MTEHAPALLPQPPRAEMPRYVVIASALQPPECNRIIAAAHAQGLCAAAVGNDARAPAIRRSDVGWLGVDGHGWLYARLGQMVQRVRQRWYPFALSGFGEPVQVARYQAEQRGHYAAHMDMGPGRSSVRKLSVVVMLSPQAAFEGGALRFVAQPGRSTRCCALAQGSAVAFPSWELHQVTPVTRGERFSLTAWVHGPPFV